MLFHSHWTLDLRRPAAPAALLLAEKGAEHIVRDSSALTRHFLLEEFRENEQVSPYIIPCA